MDKQNDFEVHDHGSLIGIAPMTQECRQWIDDSVEYEGWQWMGNVLWIEARCAEALIEGMIEAGFASATYA